jgi:CheY-like chemotaxis protein
VDPASFNDCGCESSILIVDDNCFNLIPLELILKMNFSLKCDKAMNGLEAVNMFKHHNLNKKCCEQKYSLILMDLNMPVMDGYEATKEIVKWHNH